MANTFFKSLGESDRTSSKTLLHEAIPITSSLVSGTYSEVVGSDSIRRGINIKTFSHGMFQSVYDYPYTSSSANHIFDITYGVAPTVPKKGSGFSGMYRYHDHLYQLTVSGSGLSLANKKRAIYNQMAQQLVGYDADGNVRLFDSDGNFSTGELTSTNGAADNGGLGGGKILNPIFLTFSRLLVKDEIKKGSFTLDLGVDGADGAQSGYTTPMADRQIRISDLSGSTSYKVNSPAGEYGLLFATNLKGTALDKSATDVSGSNVGLIYYQAGVAVLDGTKIFYTKGRPQVEGSIQGMLDTDGLIANHDPGFNTSSSPSNTTYFGPVALSGTVDNVADNFRHRLMNVSFNNTTELNSTIYFCRANHNEFNYSANPTYLSGSQIRVKGGDFITPPRSYVTTVGMYSADNELLAVAKLSEPLRKDPTNELTLRVRLDY